MQPKLALKIAVILVLGLLLWIPLVMIDGLIGEREALRDGVLRDMAQEAVDAQQVAGPVILVPYKRHIVDVVTEEKDGKVSSTKRERVVDGRLAFLPEQLDIWGELTPEERHRGIYKATVYGAEITVTGRFAIPQGFGVTDDPGSYEFGRPALVFGVSDPRGIGGGLKLEWQDDTVEFEPGASAPGFAGGVTAPLKALGAAGGVFNFRYLADLRGLGRIDFVPTGKESTLTLKAPWPNPSFYGRFQPASAIDDKGFAATWKTSFLSTNLKSVFEHCVAVGTVDCLDFTRNAHGVALYQPADVYQQLERASKYGFLFIGLTFIAFFLFEVLTRLAIHPVQYALVGAALAMFYLLLTSLSEQIAFPLAYAAASGACVALIGVYVTTVLRSLARGLAFTAMLAALYGVLYTLVRAEENSLLMGSVVLFALLALVMIGTRKVNWYAIETGITARPSSG